MTLHDDTGLLRGRRILVTGVLTQESIAFGVARFAQQQGARVVFTSFGRGKRLTERIAQRLPAPAPVVQLDVTSADDLAALAGRVGERLDGIDGILHSIAYAPASALGDGFLTAPWANAATAIHVSAYSLQALTVACLPLMSGGSVVGLDFDASVAWPNYAWMGVAKAALGPSRVTWPASWDPRASGSTWYPPGPCARWRQGPSRNSVTSPRSGRTGRPSAGTRPTPSPWPAPA